ncbi:hypothetical protein CKO_01597 [Citrobacter koseri ATCC BAA-895]|uniref:Uncharacterized protein n=1 Tax=Citrobacter koseri (strain ATCC BAA-895 / CDC 4225-83 / SGSC4696) TaxID=290338 RepID=A8AGW6_CITK8|nr:hypothetical protein CKO_01597 [Citrobacter koseri ATCC BAA-895]
MLPTITGSFIFRSRFWLSRGVKSNLNNKNKYTQHDESNYLGYLCSSGTGCRQGIDGGFFHPGIVVIQSAG